MATTNVFARISPRLDLKRKPVGAALDRGHDASGFDPHCRSAAFVGEHLDDQLRRLVAEQLPQLFLVISDAVALDQRDKIPLRVARQRGFTEVRVGGDKVFRRDLEIGEIAAAAAGDENFLADFFAAFDYQDAPAAFARFDGAHQTGAPG